MSRIPISCVLLLRSTDQHEQAERKESSHRSITMENVRDPSVPILACLSPSGNNYHYDVCPRDSKTRSREPDYPKMKKGMPYVSFSSRVFPLLMTLIFIETTAGDPRTETVQLMCQKPVYRNSNAAVRNFFVTMDNLSKQIQTSDSGVAVTGSGPDASYGLAQCYGDLSLVECVTCYAKARTNIPVCFPSTSGRLYLDGCFMRHENYRFFEEYTGPLDEVVCGNKTWKGITFQESAHQAVQQAVVGAPKSKGYAQSKVAVASTKNESAYALANCWSTLNASLCRACLENASTSILGCLPWSEGRALKTGCFFRYSDINFLNAEQGNGSSRVVASARTIIIIVVAAVSLLAVLVIGAAIGVYIGKQIKIKNKRKGSNDVEILVSILKDSGLNFKYSILEKATGSFDTANKLGQGGFGTVYKGVLADGREIAVKRLFLNNTHRAADFYNEINIISSMEHKNLVRLLGCSCSGPESLLVYEFLPNKSLDLFIFDPNRGKELNWEKRYEIIIGTAEGLVYLHNNSGFRTIHRDIKASNILLDSRFGAKIADFGLARSFQEDRSHVSTAIAGTLGYMAPEYLAHGRLTEKADVYCFGVLLLEIVTGRQNRMVQASGYSDGLLITAWKHFQGGSMEELIGPNLITHDHRNKNIKSEVLRVAHIGFLCTQESPSLRPTMLEVLMLLTRRDVDLPAPTNPPFMHRQTTEPNNITEDPTYALNSGGASSAATVL